METRRNGGKQSYRRYLSILLVVLMCIVMLPVGAFAAEDDVTDISQDDIITEDIITDGDEAADISDIIVTEDATIDETEEVADEMESGEAAASQQDAEVTPVVKKAKTKFTWSGAPVKFNSAVIFNQPLDKDAGPALIWITPAKTSMKVSWNAAKNTDIDGYIILRKVVGKESIYSQVATASKTATSYTDKSAKKKNTGYYYRVVGYKKVSGKIRISPSANWTAGRTTNSKLKNVYTATINKKTANLQIGESTTLSLKFAKPATTFLPAKFQWLSDNEEVATVSDNGVVKAQATGTATISGIIASGRAIKCQVTVVRAHTPGTPTIELVEADTDHITIKWKKTSYATAYNVYARSEDGEYPEEPTAVTSDAKFKYEDLTENQVYCFKVVAVNDNDGAGELSGESAEFKQAAELVPIKLIKPTASVKLKYGKNDNGVVVSWKPSPDENAGVETYEIYKGKSKDVSKMSLIGTADGSKASYQYIEKAAGTYYYAVKAIGFDGSSYTSAATSALKVLSTSILTTKASPWTATTKKAVTLVTAAKGKTKVSGGSVKKGAKVKCVGKYPATVAKFHQPTWVKVTTSSGVTGWLPYSSLKGGVKATINIKKDYTRSVKEDFVNRMGYTSTTNYLSWLCIYTQRVYTFKGSKGNWKLVRTDRTTTGRFSHPTPEITEAKRASKYGQIYKKYGRVNMVTEQGRNYFYRYASYFAPGVSYHTGTWWSDTGRRRGAVTTQPNTYGCIRMYDASAKWVYNNVPLNTSVIVTYGN